MSYRLKAADLIQLTDGIELPASGRWIIGARQTMAATRPWAVRASALEIVRGGIDVGDGQLTMTLHLEVRGIDRRSFRLGYTGQLIDADRCGRWSFDGSAMVGDHHLANLRLSVTYLGVYNHGAAPVALLQVHAEYRRPRPALRIGGQINAQRSVPFADTEWRQGVDSGSLNRCGDQPSISAQLGQIERGQARPVPAARERSATNSEDERSHV